ncbi:hypothetical protein STSP2_03273 [Anaerohalosphaera lusitana]|uniref:DUF3102 domain-containing protein n=1 Tax=Anaerohalosphaera lusitana TaxID=1936003 RepID=A0A1U9NQ59_9BACT|nr:DUF3102 domain-containing protein [Anaerohalosphaera lusitana]AQT70071.1 hypothetical protein STSP2_03273 [Anaerohalosphaera lusitana]
MTTINKSECDKMLKQVPLDVRDNLEQQFHSNELSSEVDVAETINALHRSICDMLSITVSKAIEIGGLLTEQKKEVGHGNWSTWIETNLEFKQRAASNYMRIYEHRDEIKIAQCANLQECYRVIVGEDNHNDIDDDHEIPDDQNVNQCCKGKEEKIKRPKLVGKSVAKPNFHSYTANDIINNDSLAVGDAVILREKDVPEFHLYIKESAESVRRYTYERTGYETVSASGLKFDYIVYCKLLRESCDDAVALREKIKEQEMAELERKFDFAELWREDPLECEGEFDEK